MTEKKETCPLTLEQIKMMALGRVAPSPLIFRTTAAVETAREPVLLPDGLTIKEDLELLKALPPEHKWSERELFNRLRIEGRKDPKWVLYRDAYLWRLRPYKMKFGYKEWTQPKFKDMDATLTHKAVLRMLAGVDPVPTWFSTKRLLKYEDEYDGSTSWVWNVLTFDIENGWSRRFNFYFDGLFAFGCAEARALFLSEALGNIPHLIIRTGGRGYHVLIFLRDYYGMRPALALHDLVKNVLEDAEIIPRLEHHFLRISFGPNSGIVTAMPKTIDVNKLPFRWPILESGADNLEAHFQFYNDHWNDRPLLEQVHNHLKEKWKSVTINLPKKPLADKVRGVRDLNALRADEAFDNSNDASMAAVRILAPQTADDSEVLAQAEQWLRDTGPKSSQVQDGRAFKKLPGILRKWRQRMERRNMYASPPPNHGPAPAEFVDAIERTRLRELLSENDAERARMFLEFVRQVQFHQNLAPETAVAIHRDKWIGFGCSKKKSKEERAEGYYKDVQQRLVNAGILEKADNTYEIGQRSKTFRLGASWRRKPGGNK